MTTMINIKLTDKNHCIYLLPKANDPHIDNTKRCNRYGMDTLTTCPYEHHFNNCIFYKTRKD